MFGADQIVAHLVGDYLFQSHWVATEKTKKNLPCLVHVLLYALPFLLLKGIGETFLAKDVELSDVTKFLDEELAR